MAKGKGKKAHERRVLHVKRQRSSGAWRFCANIYKHINTRSCGERRTRSTHQLLLQSFRGSNSKPNQQSKSKEKEKLGARLNIWGRYA